MKIYVLGTIGITIIVILVFAIGWFASPILSTASNVLDIHSKIEPFEPYDIAKLEYVLEQNDDYWVIVVKYTDIDTNTTIYTKYTYDLETKTLEDR